MCKGYTCNNPVCLKPLALQQPKVDLTRGNTAGRVESQETEKTICAFKNDPSTYYISGDEDIPVCVSCVLVCSVIYRRDFRQTYHAICTTVYSTVVHSRQNICLKTLPKTTPFLPKVYDRFLCYRGFRLMQVFCTYSASFKSIPASVTENRRSNSPYSPFYVYT